MKRTDVEKSHWHATEPVSILNVIHFAPDEFRPAITADFVSSPLLRQPLIDIVADYKRILRLNPLRPYVHTEGTVLATIAGFSTVQWLDRSAKLSNNDSGRLFRNGLTAFAIRDEARMIDQWRQSS